MEELQRLLYRSIEFAVYEDKILHISDKPPNKTRLDRVLKICGCRLTGEPKVEDGHWTHPIRSNNGN